MRVCVFSPSLDALSSGDWKSRVGRIVGPGHHEIVLLTNSRAEISGDQDVYVTGAAKTYIMRAYRRMLGTRWLLAVVGGRVLTWLVREAMLEALRAADPDLIVCATPSSVAWLRHLIASARAPWPCISADDPVPRVESGWRRYDPSAKVSIVLPTYNGSRYLSESIASCLGQTFRNIELIVVDDGSSEPVDAIVNGFRDPRIVFVRHPQNRGLPASLNTGFSHATGDYCSWTSDDNSYLPDAIEHLVRFIQTYPGVDFVYAESYRIDAVGTIDPRAVLRTRPAESLTHDNYIGACFLYKRAVYDGVGDFDSKAVLAEDYDYWVRVAQRFTMQRVFRRLYLYRYHDSSLTARFDRAEVVRRAQTVRRAHRLEGWSWRP